MQCKMCIDIMQPNSHNLWNYLDLGLIQIGALLRSSNLHSHFFVKGGIQFQAFHTGLSLIRRQIKVRNSFSLLMLLHTTVVWIIFYKQYLTYFKVLWYHMCCTHLTDGYWYLFSSAWTLAEAYAKLLMILKLCQLRSYSNLWWNLIACFTSSTPEFFIVILIYHLLILCS